MQLAPRSWHKKVYIRNYGQIENNHFEKQAKTYVLLIFRL